MSFDEYNQFIRSNHQEELERTNLTCAILKETRLGRELSNRIFKHVQVVNERNLFAGFPKSDAIFHSTQLSRNKGLDLRSVGAMDGNKLVSDFAAKTIVEAVEKGGEVRQ